MDNTKQTPPTQPIEPNSQQPVTTPQASQQPVSQPPVTPVSGGNKEHAPIGRVSEYVTQHPAEATPEIPKEIQEAGVEAAPSHEQPGIPEEAKNAGVQPAKESVPVTFEPTAVTEPQPDPVQLPTPMNYQQAKKEISGNPGNSKTWLAMLSKYVLEKFGMDKVV